MRPCTTSIKASVSLVFLTAAVIALCTLPGNAANDDGDGTALGRALGLPVEQPMRRPMIRRRRERFRLPGPGVCAGFQPERYRGFRGVTGRYGPHHHGPSELFPVRRRQDLRVVGRRTPETGSWPFLEALFAAADGTDMPVFVSPRYYYQHDHGWPGGSPAAHADGTGADGAGGDADWLARYTQRLNDGRTIVLSPHNGHGPDSTALARQLRRAGISKVILARLSSAPCTDARMHSLTGAGFEVMAVTMGRPRAGRYPPCLRHARTGFSPVSPLGLRPLPRARPKAPSAPHPA